MSNTESSDLTPIPDTNPEDFKLDLQKDGTDNYLNLQKKDVEMTRELINGPMSPEPEGNDDQITQEEEYVSPSPMPKFPT